ncbi:spermidine synthase [Buchananella hordeovulneris]|uniref:spermidine synthase n=1 Tax=Buchananella hordeovulneris TaxID=52770 RepID=UPI000B1C212B|nr:fused MFS/spermidine synthase [Buchananella hordeovulneris]
MNKHRTGKGRGRGARSLRDDFALPAGEVAGQWARIECVPDERGVLLLLDGVESSYLDALDAAHLEFEYMQQFAAVVDAVFPAGAGLRALHLGGGGCALARAWDATRPSSSQLVIEYDGVLAQQVRHWFALPRAPRLRIRHAEARAALAGNAGQWDVIVRDVFVGRQVPPHLRTSQFYALVRARLAAGGVFLANLADGPPLSEARREVATAFSQLPDLALISFPAVFSQRRFSNLVLASAPGVDWATTDLARRLTRLPLPATFLSGTKLAEFAAGHAPFMDPPSPTGQPAA